MIKGYITASSITDIYYILKKQIDDNIARSFIADLIEIVDVITVDKNLIIDALHYQIKDFEDAIQVAAANCNGLEIIVTRNKDDFKNCNVAIYTPKELLALNKFR
jgi:predicted nucleic acid-binding protein